MSERGSETARGSGREGGWGQYVDKKMQVKSFI